MLEVDEYGAGPPLVLIHGSPANGKTWKAVGDLLSNRFRVIAPTLPDHEVNARPSPSPMRTKTWPRPSNKSSASGIGRFV